MVRLIVCCLLIGLASSQEPDNDTAPGQTTCTAPVATRGDVAYVTCHFPDDVSKVRPVTFSVELYAPDKSSPTVVLECNWVNEEVPCRVSEDYEFDGGLTSTLTLKIKEASEENVGRYACKIMASSLQPDPKTCTLELRERDPTAATLSAPHVIIGTVSTTAKATNTSKSTQAAGSNIIIIAVVVPVAVVLIAVAVVVVVVLKRKRLLCFKETTTDAESGEKQEEAVPLNAPPPVSETGTNDAATTDATEKDSNQSTPPPTLEKKDEDKSDDGDKNDVSGKDGGTDDDKEEEGDDDDKK